MNRIDIILDQTIEDIFIERLYALLPGAPFSLIRATLGNGASGPRMGTAVWPEENSLFIIYTKSPETETIQSILTQMRIAHPNNGICAFVTPGAYELMPD